MRISREERRNKALAKREEASKGYGVYIFENNTKGELMLSRPTKSGVKRVAPGGRFEGDDYYMQMVGRDLRCIQIIQTKEQEMELAEKLITEQPPTVTTEGTVEFVKQSPAKKLNENQPGEQEDVLLNESPMDGIEII